jgi:hypothetical protein
MGLPRKINHEWTRIHTKDWGRVSFLFQVSFSAHARTFVSIRVHSWLGKSLWIFADMTRSAVASQLKSNITGALLHDPYRSPRNKFMSTADRLPNPGTDDVSPCSPWSDGFCFDHGGHRGHGGIDFATSAGVPGMANLTRAGQYIWRGCRMTASRFSSNARTVDARF